MTRKEKVAKHFQKKHLLTVSNSFYKEQLLALFDWMKICDGVADDLTTKYLGLSGQCVAEVISKQAGVISGIEEIAFLLDSKTTLVVDKHVSGDVLLRLSGNVKEILGLERIILNIIGRMSGIATYTNLFLQKIKEIPNPPLLVSTRKTPWMLLDKKAVCDGGGGTHRLSLSDFALVKNTHLFTSDSSIEKVVQKMMASGDFFEIEVGSIQQAEAVIDILEKAQYQEAAIMLDNVSPKIALEFMDKFKNHPFYEHVYIEASGEVTKDNLLLWADTGVDVISSGSLTHSAPAFNVSMLTKTPAF
ncbi:MAG: carboxylating.nicotinate-nucleotide diphosphorylase [Candidatus Levyibacteriota bacterium]|nr:MAG: carboxylating.nicotinate-nucleotide diphosphorylase [Candidatus Levybacteria bacterium]